MEQKSELLPYAGVNGIGFTLCNLFKRKKESTKNTKDLQSLVSLMHLRELEPLRVIHPLGPQHSKSISLVMKAYFHYTPYFDLPSFLYVYMNYG